MFKPFIGACISCSRKKVIIPVKSGLCVFCNHKKKQDKKKESGKKIGGYKFIKEPTGEKELFLEIWQNSNQRCFVCDKPILQPIVSNFMHVLPKALNKYPKYKTYVKNVVLGCHDSETSCHHRYDKMPRNTLTEPMWQKLFTLEKELKQQYPEIK